MAEKKNSKSSSAKKSSSTKTSVTKETTKKSTNTKTSTKKTTSSKPKTTKKVVKEEVKVVTPVVEEVKEEKKSLIEVIKANSTLICLCMICLLLIINIILITVGHKVELSDGKQVVASIDGKAITADELYESIKETSGTNSLINMIDNEIIKKEITDVSNVEKQAKEEVAGIKEQYEEMEYNWSDVLTNYGYASEQELIDELKDSYLKKELVVKYISKDLKEEDIQKYYNENVYDSYTAKHILIIPDTTDSMSDDEKSQAEAAALATANEVITKLNNGEAWSTLVSSYSEDTGSKESDGLIENFTYGEVVDEFFNATKNLNDGSYTTEPVKSKFGYHIILRVSKTDKEALENIKNDLINEIIDSKLSNDSNLYTTTWDKIRKQYNLKINDTTIEKYYNEAIKG